ncbi:MAG: ABC transporter ATP-binding protein [Candidatus Latescibacteria bacterium]|jgi:lipoprotein-releasing system ATP-binding protein|nr:ABC transporter ATP-binding protein [Candidatus Latescibacterota bacterium]
MDSLLEASGIRKRFRMGETDLEVLKGVDLRVDRGEVVAVVGPSGVGKSTLLHILGALDSPTAGSVRIDSTDVFALADRERARFRNAAIGFVFQFHHLLADFTAVENVMLPLMIRGCDTSAARPPAAELLKDVGLEERMDHLPSELSGGESQRVAVARALVARPKLLLADEPSGNLDLGRSAELHDLMFKLAHDLGQTVVVVTHDASLANRADRIIRMEDGRIAAGG